tara:strand:+ start:48 stop:239 length:192 start_codon:yes stop_codon:yes gene_type:complete
MNDRQFKFILFNFTNNERREFVTRDRTMNEAISKAYVKTHSLRKNGKDNWQIISATDSVTNSL